MNLFFDEPFTGHAGGSLSFKIECDALTSPDYATLARLVANRFTFRSVHGIPSGGLAFAHALEPYWTQDGQFDLIVDDVYTTGRSMNDFRHEQSVENPLGIVVFARGPIRESWVYPFFMLHSLFYE